MVERGLLEETADLLASGTLNPASPPGRAIGYRQAIEYLQRADVGDAAAEAGALKTFLEDFATATRRYAKQQMVWYRGASGVPLRMMMNRAVVVAVVVFVLCCAVLWGDSVLTLKHIPTTQPNWSSCGCAGIYTTQRRHRPWCAPATTKRPQLTASGGRGPSRRR